MNFDAYGNPIKPRGSGVVVPLLMVLLVSLGANYWLWKERTKSAMEANAATAKLAAAEAVHKEQEEKLAKVEAERTELAAAKEQAEKDAQAKATELAKLKDDVAGVEVDKERTEPPADDKASAKSDKKDKSDRSDKSEREKKADAKAKAKAKAKKKEASHKKDSGGSKEPADREL